MSDPDQREPSVEQAIRVLAYTLGLCAVATRQGAGYPIDDHSKAEARAIEESVAHRWKEIIK